MELETVRKQLDYLVKHEWIHGYTLNNDGELWFTYGLSSVGSTTNYTDYLAIHDTDLAKMFEKLAEEVGDDLQNSADSCGDFFGYDSQEELDDRIEEESSFLKRLSEIVKGSDINAKSNI